MIKDLIKLANNLDSIGLNYESKFVKKLAQQQNYRVPYSLPTVPGSGQVSSLQPGPALIPLAAYDFGSRLVNRLIEASSAGGQKLSELKQYLSQVSSQYTYTGSLEQTDYIKTNVKGFYLTVSNGDVLNKTNGNVLKENFVEELPGNSFMSPSAKSTVKGSGGYPSGGTFIPKNIAATIFFKNGAQVSLFAQAQINPIKGIANAVFSEASIKEKYGKKYPQGYKPNP